MSAAEQQLYLIFTFYSVRGNPWEPQFLTKQQFVKLCADCRLMRGRVGRADCEVLFSSIVSQKRRGIEHRKMTFPDFAEALLQLAGKVRVEMRPMGRVAAALTPCIRHGSCTARSRSATRLPASFATTCCPAHAAAPWRASTTLCRTRTPWRCCNIPGRRWTWSEARPALNRHPPPCLTRRPCRPRPALPLAPARSSSITRRSWTTTCGSRGARASTTRRASPLRPPPPPPPLLLPGAGLPTA